MTPIEKLYTSEDVAKILKIDRQVVLRYIREKKIKSIKIGKAYRIKESAIEDFTSYE